MRLSKSAGVRTGVAAAGLAIIANVGVIALGAAIRAWVAPLVAIFAAVAASKAFSVADDGPRDDVLERSGDRAGQGLVAVAIAEAMMALVAGFVWAAN
jgi:hypothetical protein